MRLHRLPFFAGARPAPPPGEPVDERPAARGRSNHPLLRRLRHPSRRCPHGASDGRSCAGARSSSATSAAWPSRWSAVTASSLTSSWRAATTCWRSSSGSGIWTPTWRRPRQLRRRFAQATLCRCGAPLIRGAHFCSHCGRPRPRRPPSSPAATAGIRCRRTRTSAPYCGNSVGTDDLVGHERRSKTRSSLRARAVEPDGSLRPAPASAEPDGDAASTLRPAALSPVRGRARARPGVLPRVRLAPSTARRARRQTVVRRELWSRDSPAWLWATLACAPARRPRRRARSQRWRPPGTTTKPGGPAGRHDRAAEPPRRSARFTDTAPITIPTTEPTGTTETILPTGTTLTRSDDHNRHDDHRPDHDDDPLGLDPVLAGRQGRLHDRPLVDRDLPRPRTRPSGRRTTRSTRASPTWES